MKPFYPERVNELFLSARHIGRPDEFDSAGAGASLACGVSVRMFLAVNGEGVLKQVRFVTSGCGWAIAAAEAASGLLEGRKLIELHALDDLEDGIGSALGGVPERRESCIATATEAVRSALAELRQAKAAEWKGETALICSCFSVSEETIETLVETRNAQTVEDIGDLCGAGTGCGSCQMLIREIISEGLRTKKGLRKKD